MNVAIVDKNYRFVPHNLNKSLIVKLEVEINDDAELNELIKYLLKFVKSDKENSGVQPVVLPPEKPKLSLKIEKEEESSPIDPISSLEIE